MWLLKGKPLKEYLFKDTTHLPGTPLFVSSKFQPPFHWTVSWLGERTPALQPHLTSPEIYGQKIFKKNTNQVGL